MPPIRTISAIEERFKEVSKVEGDLSIYPLEPAEGLLTKGNSEDSEQFGEVFTPLWLVDRMLDKVSPRRLRREIDTLDLCAGYGQFTIRLLRKKQTLLGREFNLRRFLYSGPRIRASHYLSELQVRSCYKLLYIFGANRDQYPNLFIGDARELGKTPKICKGIYFYSEYKGEWEEITEDILRIFGKPTKYSPEQEEKFISVFHKWAAKRENRYTQQTLFY